MSDRPTVLDSSTTDETPRRPVTTTAQRTADPPPAPSPYASFSHPSISERPTVLHSSAPDAPPRSPVTTTVQRTADPPSDTSRRERAAEQARQEQQAAHEQLLLTAGLLHMR